jgi:hypothetical protein
LYLYYFGASLQEEEKKEIKKKGIKPNNNNNNNNNIAIDPHEQKTNLAFSERTVGLIGRVSFVWFGSPSFRIVSCSLG